MSTLSYAFSDSMTMLRRNLRRTLRYPASVAATLGIPIGNSGVLAVAWSVGIGLVGYLWAKRLFNRDPMP
jgi:hypothetical protein